MTRETAHHLRLKQHPLAKKTQNVNGFLQFKFHSKNKLQKCQMEGQHA